MNEGTVNNENPEVKLYRDIQLLRRMFLLITTKKEWKVVTGFSGVMNVVNQLKTFRSMQRQRKDPLETRLQRREEAAIISYMGNLVQMRGLSAYVTVAKNPTVKAIYKFYRKEKRVTVTVGYLWRRSVWDKVHQDNRMTTAHLILSATEYRTNTPHIRIYKATAFSFSSRKVLEGWIAQSKIGKQKCEFLPIGGHTNAILVAKKLAAKAVDNKIMGKGE